MEGLERHKPNQQTGSKGGQKNKVQCSWVKYSSSRAKSVDLAAWYPFIWIFTVVNEMLSRVPNARL